MTSRPKPSYGPLLALLRERKGLTQDQLATLGGITRKAVSRYETGVRNVPERRFASLCAVLGYTPPEVEAWLLAFRALPGEDLAAAVGLPCAPGLAPELDRKAREAVAQIGEALGAEAAPRFGRALQAATWRRERQRGERLGRRLLAAPASSRRLLLAHSPLYCSWPVVEWLCHASEIAAARTARLAHRIARVGLQVAEASSGSEAARLQGYAWGYVGNALRVSNDLRGADQAFTNAWRNWRNGEESTFLPLAEWRLLDREASLRNDQARPSTAITLLNRAAATAPKEAQGRILLNLAWSFEQLGRHAQALEALGRAELLVDCQADLRLHFAVHFNQATNLIALNRATAADSLLPEVQGLVNQLGTRLDLHRTLWLQGRVDCALGRLDRARTSLEQVLSFFCEDELTFDAALAGLDLAVVHLEKAELSRVRELAEEMAWLFKDSAFAQEGIAALQLFWESARREEATAALARETWAAVQRAGLNTRSEIVH